MKIRVASKTLAFGLAAIFASQNIAHAKGVDGYVTYKVKRGDTLIVFAQKYLKRPSLYKAIQRQNKITYPRAMRIGTNLKIPRSLLKFTKSKAIVAAVRGNVISNKRTVKSGDSIGEGALLTTRSASYITLTLEDGSRISLPSNSNVRVKLLRKYMLDNSIDYDFAVLKGGARSKVSRKKSPYDRYRVRSPKAVSAVRGTDFQVRYNDITNNDFAEVVEGGLAVNSGNHKALSLPAGNGLAVAANGDASVEALLPEPSLIDGGKTQVDEILSFKAKQRANEKGYRFTMAADAGFLDVIADKTVDAPALEINAIPNGNYFLRVRAIAKSGLQGLPVTTGFRRRLNSVSGSTAQGEDGFKFKWVSAGEGKKNFHFQIFKDSKDGIALIDEAGLETTSITISELPAGKYFWRIGSTQYLDGEVSTNWANFEKLTLSE